MTLLDDLQALDLSAILDGKLEVRAVIDGDAIANLVSTGAATRVLGDLGTAIQVAVDGFQHPEALAAPIVDVLAAVLDEIGIGDGPLGEYVEAVTGGAQLVAGLVGTLSGDPRAMSFGSTGNVGELLDRVGGPFADHAAAVSGGLARFRALVQSVERGLPADPSALLGPALEILLPFPTGEIGALRGRIADVTTRLDRVTIDPQLTAGLVAALAEVRVAADAGDVARLQATIGELARIRDHTVQQLAAAMRSIASALSGIRLGDALGAVSALRGTLGGAGQTVLDQLDEWRSMIASVRATVEELDPAAAITHFRAFLDLAETTANDVLLAGVDGSVHVVSQALRDLLREIPIRPLRMQLSAAIANAARAIADADLDAPIDTLRGGLAELSALLDAADPAALVQSAVAELEAAISDAIDRLEGAVGQITAGIENVAADAEGVLQRAVAGLREFRTVVDGITVTVENAGILDAAAEIAATLQDLREQVSELVSKAPVPDALREPIGQLIATIDSIDLDAAIGTPLREVAAQLEIPGDVAVTVTDGLAAVVEAVSALVPTDVIAELEAMMNDAIAEIEQLDVSALTSGLTTILDDAASVFESVSIADVLRPAGDVFDGIVAAVDAVHPRRILRPVIDLYAQTLGALPVPTPETMTTRTAEVTSQAGESVARAAAEPVRQAVSPSATTPAAGVDAAGPAREEPPADLRVGDIVRLVGFLPAKLRDAVAALGAGPAGDVLAGVDDLLRGSAAAIRDLRDRVVAIDAAVATALDTALAPLTAAQVDAQLAVQGSAAVSAEGFELDASFAILASAGPAALQRQLAGERELIGARSAEVRTALTGRVADDLDQVAALLERFLPSALLDDVDAFLAALDPEPIAAELDALVVAIVDATPGFLTAAADGIAELEARIRALIATFNPGALAQRFLAVLDVVREELALLDPGRLADELGEVHAQIKGALTAYDPRAIAAGLDQLLADVAAAIRGLDPAGLLPDLSGVGTQVARLGDILPVNALAGVGTQLEAVGDELRELDVQGMLDVVNSVPPDIAEAITLLIAAVRDEIKALLESVKYASTSASASVSVSVSASGGGGQ